MTPAGGAPVQVLTVGHSNHSPEAFLALLTRHGVTALGDVRSAPWSRFNPHFNRKALSASLPAGGIAYAWLGRELGGRPDDPACYEDGGLRYDRLAQTALYRQGIARVLRGAAEHRLALMCAEKDPLHCHRALLVSRSLEDEGLEPWVPPVPEGGAVGVPSAAQARPPRARLAATIATWSGGTSQVPRGRPARPLTTIEPVSATAASTSVMPTSA